MTEEDNGKPAGNNGDGKGCLQDQNNTGPNQRGEREEENPYNLRLTGGKKNARDGGKKKEIIPKEKIGNSSLQRGGGKGNCGEKKNRRRRRNERKGILPNTHKMKTMTGGILLAVLDRFDRKRRVRGGGGEKKDS